MKSQELLEKIAKNSLEKIISSMQLYFSGQYNTAYFLAMIAQEELSKLIILPLAEELGELDSMINNRSHIYFNHVIKQKIFTSFGLQNRSHREIQQIKEKCLYVGPGKNLIAYQEMNEAVVFFEVSRTMQSIAHQLTCIYLEDSLPYSLKREVIRLFNLAIDEAEKYIPGIILELQRVSSKPKIMNILPIELKCNYICELFLSNPYNLINMFKRIFKDQFRIHLKAIQKLSLQEIQVYLVEKNKLSTP